MNNCKTIFTFFLFGFLLTGCARKPIYTYGTGATMNRTSIPGKILSLRTVGISDTVTAYISGAAFGKDSIDGKVTIDTLVFAFISFINHDRKDTIVTTSDMNGRFEKHVEAGTYDILVKYVGYTGLMVTNVPLLPGELKELNVLLGQQGQIIVESVVDADSYDCSSYFDRELNKQVYNYADKMPEYENGTSALLSFFSKNFVYPKEQQDNYQGSIDISFIVDTDGHLKNIDAEKKFYGDKYSPVDLEAIRVFKLMPAWIPGQCNGTTVPLKMEMPIKIN
jgi:hypothetical protein